MDPLLFGDCAKAYVTGVISTKCGKWLEQLEPYELNVISVEDILQLSVAERMYQCEKTAVAFKDFSVKYGLKVRLNTSTKVVGSVCNILVTNIRGPEPTNHDHHTYNW